MKKEKEVEKEQKGQGPAFVKRIGSVKCSVFENAAESGRMYSNLSVVRRYRANDGEWHDTNVLNGTADGLAAIEALRCAIDFVNHREVERNESADE
ncbi:MAG: hypothetical protein SGI77_02900 [Pirellulaceae bacterium]|nr:hypothetical protein [Pirellulaceae bacterium]